MSKKLIVIESPNKIQTIQKFLGKDYKILATIGHIRDLSTRGFGFDEKTLEPHWVIQNSKSIFGKKNSQIKPKKEIINEIKEEAIGASEIFLATDPDREGEAIAWHVYDILHDDDKEKVKRITFNEITEPAVNDALSHPRKIDMRWVESQFARRILDRLVGFSLSKLVRKKLHAQSAGRVQTVALKFIYDREQEINKFKEKKWWTLDVSLQGDIKLILREINPLNEKKIKFKKIDDEHHGTGIEFLDIESAQEIKKTLEKWYEIYQIDEPQFYISNPKDPYKTSTLQQDAINKLGWNINKVTSIAQRLYEGVEIKKEHHALISYPRTDSLRIADTFVKKLEEFIVKKYGKEYYCFRTFVDKKHNKTATKGNNVQDAHEAIRVIDPTITPESIKPMISHDEYLLYCLIWIRTVAAFMTPAKYQRIIVRLSNNKNKFYTYENLLVYDGWKKIDHYEKEKKNHQIKAKDLKIGQKFIADTIEIKEHASQPPPRYNQASLVKALDEAGVGRPSTYKSMANMAVERHYAKMENRAYHMLPIGNEVIVDLENFFPYIVDPIFTKEMEIHLDEIAHNDEDWKKWVLEFKPKLEKDIKKANEKIVKEPDEQVGRNCPKCGAPLIFRYAKKTGDKFIGCSAFPNCTYAEFPEQEKPKILEELCPLCGSHLIERSGKRGSRFIGCSAYPNCHYMRPIKKNPNDKKNNVKADIENQDSDDDMIAVKEDKKKKNAKTK